MRILVCSIVYIFTIKAQLLSLFHESSKNTLMDEQCSTFKSNFYVVKNQNCNTNRIYIFDFSSDFMTSYDFYDIKYLLKESIKDWFNRKTKATIKICNINEFSYDYEDSSYTGYQECGNLNDCYRIIDKLEYTNVTHEYWNNTELVNEDITFANDYSNNLTTILSNSFIQCPFNSAILLTNRIVDMRDGSAIKAIKEICKEKCIEFSVILLGRNEFNATQELITCFDFVSQSLLFNIPEYNCVANLVPCIQKYDIKECTNMTVTNCSPVSTTTALITRTTTEAANTFHITYILGFENITQYNFNLVTDNIKRQLEEYPQNRPFKIKFITFSYISPQIIQSMEELDSFFQTINVSNPIIFYLTTEEFINRIKLAIDENFFEIGDEKRMILLTNFFDTNISQSDLVLLTNFYLQIYVYEQHQIYLYYAKLNITCNFLSDYNSTIPLLLPTSSTSIISSSTFIPTKSNTEKSTMTSPKNSNPSTQNDKEKIYIIVICCIIVTFVVILLLSIFLYRRRLQQKKLEKIRKSHQNPLNIDEWELTWDKLMIKGEELGSGAFGQVLQGKLIGLEKTKNGKLIEEKEDVAIKILQRYTNELSEKNFLNEIHTMKLINGHKNIVKMIGCITVGDRICLVLEFCPYRDLLQYSKTKKAELDPFFPTFDHITKEFLIFAWQISNGMQYLASEGIIHRDLAARNILINEFKIAKISDFGLSVKINDKLKNSISKNILQIETGKLPVKWLAIESLKNYEFSLQSDMFTFGETPFSEIENSQLLEYLETGNRPEKPEICSDEIYEIMLKCWNNITTLRPGFDELITFFTIFLEHSTENYGYLDVIKSGKEDSKELKRIIYPKI